MAEMTSELRVVAAGRGAAWWVEGWHLFTPAMGTWIGIVIIYGVLAIVISQIPYVGDVGHWLLTPVFTAGLMVGCQEMSRGEKLRVAHLFEGFHGAHFVPLIVIGAINMAVAVGIAAVTTAGILGGMRLTDVLRMGTFGDPMGTLGNLALRVGVGGLLVTLLALAVAAIFAMLNWFAPALVILHGAQPLAAMKNSFVACWRNWLPFLVYGMAAILFAVVVVVMFGALIFGFGATAIFGGNDSSWSAIIGLVVIFGLLMLIGVLIMLPVVFGATYASYLDIFATDHAPTRANPEYR